MGKKPIQELTERMHLALAWHDLFFINLISSSQKNYINMNLGYQRSK